MEKFKKYLPLLEAINSICWFWFDFSWMQEWSLSAKIGSLLAMLTGLIVASISWTWSSIALMNWLFMNVLWMNEYNTASSYFGVMGFICILISFWKEGNLDNFTRLKINKK